MYVSGHNLIFIMFLSNLYKMIFVILLCIIYINAQDCNYCNCDTINHYSVPCDCTKIYSSSNCTSNNILLYSPESFIFPSKVEPNKIEQIILHDMININNLSFPQKMENLRKLTVNSCNTIKIDKNSFSNVETLTELTVENNNLLIVYQDTFENISKLNALNLKNNFIKDFSENYLKNLLNLKRFNLGNNEIETLSSTLFAGNRNLEEIYLFENNIINLPKKIFNGLTNVMEINLRNNKIQVLPDEIFSNLQKLQEIDLQNNEIKSIEADVFKGSPQLETLNLDGNNIQNIDYNILINLPQLNLLYSSINCDCKLRPFFSTYEKRKISGKIYCSGPNILVDKNFAELSIEDFVCAPKILNCSEENNENITKISCQIYGDPLPQISWTLNGTNISLDYELYNLKFQNIDEEKVWLNLTVLSVSEFTSGLYEIQVRNNRGYDSISHYLKYKQIENTNNVTVLKEFDEKIISTAHTSTYTVIVICINAILIGILIVAGFIYCKMNCGKLGEYNVQENEFQDHQEACTSTISLEPCGLPKEDKIIDFEIYYNQEVSIKIVPPVNPVPKPPRTFTRV